LEDVVKLRVEASDARIDVVLEEPAKGCPKISRSRHITKHQIKKLSEDPCVDPLDDGEIVLAPTRITWARGTKSVAMWSRRLQRPRWTLKRWHKW
jgi:hypothetical protein